MAERLSITPVETAADIKTFVHFQWEVYKDDPLWVPPLLSERFELMDPARHPFYEHATVKSFLARRGDKIVGRISALINHRHNEFWNEKIGFFGLYEVLEDAEASQALLAAAEDFVRSQGMTTLRGPANCSTQWPRTALISP